MSASHLHLQGLNWGLSVLFVPTGVFLPSAPASTKNPCGEDMGVVALTPLTDMLNVSQLSPAAGSLVTPLAAPLNPLLSGQIPLSQNNQFANLVPCSVSNQLTNPITVSPGVTLASSLGLPSTRPLNSQMTSPLTVPPGTTLASSLGLTSTGSLTTSSRLVGPMAVSQSSPIMAPLAGTVAVSLSGPLLSSTATPLGVSQNILPNPINNVGLSEAPRVQLAEPPRGKLAGTSGPAPTSKGNWGPWVGRFLLPACLTLTLPLSSTPPHSQSPVNTPSRARTQSPSTSLWVRPSRPPPL